jgi:cell division protein ZapA
MDRVEVEIMGQRLTVASDEGEAHVRRVAGYVDGQMRQMAAGRTATGMADLALMTALNIASEYWKLHDQQEELHRTINRLSDRVTAHLGE